MATIDEALAIAVAHHRADRLSEAADLYRRVLQVDAGNFNALHLLGLVERRHGNLDAAIGLIGQAVAKAPHFVEAHTNLANTLDAAGRSGEAAAALRRAIVLAPEAAPPYHTLGRLLGAKGGPDGWRQAIAGLGRALRLTPDLIDARYHLGLALRQTERLEEATAEYRVVLARQPDFAGAHMSLGNAFLEDGARSAAERSFRRGIALMPASPELHYNLGNALHAQGRTGDALAVYRRSARLGANNAFLRAGAVLDQMDRLDEAEAAYRTALARPGTELSTAIQFLAALKIRRGQLDEARALFTDLRDRPLGGGTRCGGECLTALASIELHRGRPREALALTANVRGDDSRLFTVRSLAAFQTELADRGLRLERPADPDPARPRITSSTLATHGRFAHNALEYVLIRLYAEKHGYALETPDWVGGAFFDLDDPPQSRPLSPLYFGRRFLNRVVSGTGRADDAPIADCDILSPLFLFEHKEAYRARVQSWLKPRPVWRPRLDPAMEALRARGDTVVAVHIRRGDFVQYNYPITETAWYVEWLRGLWPTLRRPVLYIASDDLAGVRKDFAEFAPLTLNDVAEPWAGMEYLQDFHVLCNADVVGISAASGYSLLAARLNTNARLFAEPDVGARRVRPFSPWVA